MMKLKRLSSVHTEANGAIIGKDGGGAYARTAKGRRLGTVFVSFLIEMSPSYLKSCLYTQRGSLVSRKYSGKKRRRIAQSATFILCR